MKEYPTQPGKEGKLKARIVHAVRVKIRHRNFSNNAVPDLNENISGSTDLAQKWHGSADLRTPIYPPHFSGRCHCKVKSAYEPAGPSSRSLSRFQ